MKNDLYHSEREKDKKAVSALTLGETAREAGELNEDLIKHLFLNNPQPMWVYDLRTLAFVDVNDAAVTKYGYSREEFLSMTIKDIRPSEDVPALLQNVSSVTEGLDVVPGTWRHIKKDGTVIDVEITSHTMEYDGRKAEMVFPNDVTHRRAEAALRLSRKALQDLTDFDTEMLNLNFQQVLSRSIEFIEGRLGISRASVTLLEDDMSGLRMLESTHVVDGLKRGQLLPMDKTVLSRVIERETPLYRPDIAGWDEKFDLDHLLVSSGLRSDFLMPLIAEGRCLGTLNCGSERVDGFGPDTRCLLTLISSRLAQAVMNSKLYDAARESEETARALLSAPTDSATLLYRDGTICGVNEITCHRLGRSEEELIGACLWDLFPPDVAEKRKVHIAEVFASGKPLRFVDEHEGIWNDNVLCPVRNSRGQVTKVAVLARDITDIKQGEEERARLEEQLAHSQKMEAVGQLAGGVAHDFNNILTAIMGYAHIMSMKMTDENPLKPYVSHIIEASERAAGLTRSLLAFSRKQVISLRPIDLNETLQQVEKLISRLIGEDIEVLLTSLQKGPVTVMADPGQLEQIMMNLATNARDAMPDGGRLTISTSLSDDGTHALLRVSDNGTGMDQETCSRIFEPFFSTKEVGRGTGLGLSMVYGIVKQHGGHIKVDSTPGRGTTFTISFPCAEQGWEEAEAVQDANPKGGTETVLLAEDASDVRALMREVLLGMSYRVIEAADGEEAVKKFKQYRNRINLLVLDVIMPRKNGKQVYDEIKSIKPGIKVLFTSGYTAGIIGEKGVIDDGLDFISKPVTPGELLRKVREVLDK